MTEEKKQRYVVEQVPVGYEPKIIDKKEEKVVEDREVLTQILNKLEKIEKAVA